MGTLGRREFFKAGAILIGGALSGAFSEEAEAAIPRADIAFIPGCPENPLYKFHEDEIIYPASLTKIMTVMLLLDEVRKGNLDLDRDMIEITDEARAATVKGKWNLPERQAQTVTVREAIQLAMARSYNDVAYAIAQKVAGLKSNEAKIRTAGYEPGSEEAFCKVLMLEKLEELGLKKTRFCNSNGLPPYDTDVIIVGDPRDYYNISTASDMAVIWNELLTKYPEFRPILSASSIIAPDGYTPLVSTGLQVKKWLTQCLNACRGFKPDDVMTKTGTTNGNHNIAYSVPRIVASCGGPVEIAFLTLGHPQTIARNAYARDLTNKVFKSVKPTQVADIRAIIEAKKIPPHITSHPVMPPDVFISIPYIEPAELEMPLLPSRNVSTLRDLIFPQGELIR